MSDRRMTVTRVPFDYDHADYVLMGISIGAREMSGHARRRVGRVVS